MRLDVIFVFFGCLSALKAQDYYYGLGGDFNIQPLTSEEKQESNESVEPNIDISDAVLSGAATNGNSAVLSSLGHGGSGGEVSDVPAKQSIASSAIIHGNRPPVTNSETVVLRPAASGGFHPIDTDLTKSTVQPQVNIAPGPAAPSVGQFKPVEVTSDQLEARPARGRTIGGQTNLLDPTGIFGLLLNNPVANFFKDLTGQTGEPTANVGVELKQDDQGNPAIGFNRALGLLGLNGHDRDTLSLTKQGPTLRTSRRFDIMGFDLGSADNEARVNVGPDGSIVTKTCTDSDLFGGIFSRCDETKLNPSKIPNFFENAQSLMSWLNKKRRR